MTGQYSRYREDAEVLAAIGTAIGEHRITVRLPRALAEAAVAAWQRDETEPVGAETPEQWALRDLAAELALIGLAVTERGRADGEFVTVDLDVGSAGAAARAALR
ncbi:MULTISPECIES: hypothetical protein [Amycolatopsis]|uniref:Transcriptional regulator n=1 Tax=Amycolatopsis thermalba TaxID=944492 RepID=A0ABY4NWK7_9PSEU|nr:MULTISPECIES: hypothetical protein [Amycolatopsis]OXM67547.1 hypothetical protein CF166_24410 [Amycolatopsis sp. KNN50.9b]UQS24435.1 hypothetical protein L1857_17200 [Amycolatopsis thermalba]